MAVEIVYAGDVAAGQTLVIDPDDDSATLDGQDVSDQLEILEVFELQVGTNVLEYNDDEGSRDLTITVAWNPRYV